MMCGVDKINPKPEVLTFRFHNFRPSDRQAIREVLTSDGGVAIFVSALEIYMEKWAKADWLTEYDIERIAFWTATHFPKNTSRASVDMASRQLRSAQSEQAKRTYSLLLDAFEKELGEPAQSDTWEGDQHAPN